MQTKKFLTMIVSIIVSALSCTVFGSGVMLVIPAVLSAFAGLVGYSVEDVRMRTAGWFGGLVVIAIGALLFMADPLSQVFMTVGALGYSSGYLLGWAGLDSIITVIPFLNE